MMLPQPQTIFSDLVGQINGYVTRGGPYQDEKSFQIRRLITEIEKLGSGPNAVAQKNMLLGAVAQICGNEDRMRSCFKTAKQLQDDSITAHQFSAALINLGYVLESQREFAIAANPENGHFSNCIDIGFSNLSINILHDYYTKAVNMGFANIDPNDIELTRNVRDILAQENVTDSLAASIMDEAGHILRQHQLMRCITESSDLKFFDRHGGKPFVMVTWHVPVSTKQAAIMNAELSARLAENFETIPDCFSIGFEGIVQ